MEFLVDTGATFSVLNQAFTLVDDDFVTVRGATGQSEKTYFLKPLKFKLGKQLGVHKFLYMPNLSRPLLGQDLLEQLKTEIRFDTGKVELRVGSDQLIEVLSLALINTPIGSGVPEEVQNQVYPGVWATKTLGKAKNASPITVKPKQGKRPVRIRQYPLRMEDRAGI